MTKVTMKEIKAYYEDQGKKVTTEKNFLGRVYFIDGEYIGSKSTLIKIYVMENK